jgi:hypothetical protein
MWYGGCIVSSLAVTESGVRNRESELTSRESRVESRGIHPAVEFTTRDS